VPNGSLSSDSVCIEFPRADSLFEDAADSFAVTESSGELHQCDAHEVKEEWTQGKPSLPTKNLLESKTLVWHIRILEVRTMLTVSLIGAPSWVEQVRVRSRTATTCSNSK